MTDDRQEFGAFWCGSGSIRRPRDSLRWSGSCTGNSLKNMERPLKTGAPCGSSSQPCAYHCNHVFMVLRGVVSCLPLGWQRNVCSKRLNSPGKKPPRSHDQAAGREEESFCLSPSVDDSHEGNEGRHTPPAAEGGPPRTMREEGYWMSEAGHSALSSLAATPIAPRYEEAVRYSEHTVPPRMDSPWGMACAGRHEHVREQHQRTASPPQEQFTAGPSRGQRPGTSFTQSDAPHTRRRAHHDPYAELLANGALLGPHLLLPGAGPDAMDHVERVRLRNTLAMELLWTRQAIESRVQVCCCCSSGVCGRLTVGVSNSGQFLRIARDMQLG
jgi:hypothetical protein